MTFLEKTANHIFRQHSLSELRNICVVLPNKRAVLYFKQAIAQLADRPFLSPEVTAIDDFVMRMSGTKQIDYVSLLFELYETFKIFDSSVEFDKFITWAPTLLRDFDLIDQYMVENPKSLFEYMSEAQAIERWQLLIPENQNLKKTQIIDKYFALFVNINNVYNEFKSRLSDEGFAYRGMAYRIFANEIQQLLVENPIFEKYYFVGFNALSKSEEKIIETLIKSKRAEILWDADSYLLDPSIGNKGGKILRKYKSSNKFGEWNWLTEHLLTEEKKINIYGVENATLQAKIAGEIYREILKQNPETQTAIVLCDENLINPVLYSLHAEVKNFNITMGLSLRSSSLFTLINAIFELQQNIVEFKTKDGNKVKIPKYSHRHISKILNHPLIRPIVDKQQTQGETILKQIIANNLVFLSEKEILDLGGNEHIYKIIFTRWNDDATKALKSFYLLIDELREIYKENKDSIEIEYLYLFLTILNRLEKILFSNREFSLKSFKHFLYELIRQERIPFSGEPIANLQIMGMLETRCLDFERVILLSVNEGIIPIGKKQNSLIPYDAALSYGLPVNSDQDAIMAYHFFRLLQRAKEIDIMYVLPTGEGVGGGGGEKSRFILQIENELYPRNKEKIKLSYPTVNLSQVVDNEKVIKIDLHKNEQIIFSLEKLFAERGIYPTYLSEYLNCQLKFYFSKIAEISMNEEIDEKFGADIFGTWLHNTLEKIDKDYGPEISEDNIKKILTEISDRLDETYKQFFGGYVIDNGMNYLLKQVGEQLLTSFFKNQLETQTFPIEVMEVETKIETTLEVNILGKVQKVKIAGRVDRIEREGKTLRVIDYKTGKVEKKDLKEDGKQTLEEAILDPDKDKLRQLWLYQYLMLKKMSDEKLILKGERLDDYLIKAKIYSFRNIKENLEVNLQFDSYGGVSGFIQKSEEILSTLITEILNPEVAFVQTSNLQYCQNCDFCGICGR